MKLVHQVNLFFGRSNFWDNLKKTRKISILHFFSEFFCIETWARMLFASSNCRYIDVLRNKRVINDKWTKSEGPNYAFLYSDENYKEKMIFLWEKLYYLDSYC